MYPSCREHLVSRADTALTLPSLPRGWVVAQALALGIASLVGVAVIYLGVHWLSDVVAGAVQGAVIGCAVARLVRVRDTVVGLPGRS